MYFKLIFLFIFINIQTSASITRFACSYFPPYKIQADGKSKGVDVEIISEIFKEINLQTSFTFLPWKRAYNNVKTGELDALCGCSYLKSREKHFIYSNEIGKQSIGFFTMKGKKSFTNIEELKDKNVAVVRGYNLESELNKSQVKVIPVKDESQLIRLLKSGRVDAIYSFRGPILYLMKENSIIDDMNFKEMKSSPYYICFNKKKLEKSELIAQFNTGLNTIKNNGLYNKIRIKYFGKPLN
jgi:polar amino acid transport system substrate-binding protein